MYPEISCHISVFSPETDGLQSEQKNRGFTDSFSLFSAFCCLYPSQSPAAKQRPNISNLAACHLRVLEPQRTKTGNRLTDKTNRFPPSGCRDSYLESVASEAESQLSADHHGLHGPPAIAAHGPPHQRTVPLHQHLHAALVRVTTSTQTQLQAGKTQRMS